MYIYIYIYSIRKKTLVGKKENGKTVFFLLVLAWATGRNPSPVFFLSFLISSFPLKGNRCFGRFFGRFLTLPCRPQKTLFFSS